MLGAMSAKFDFAMAKYGRIVDWQGTREGRLPGGHREPFLYLPSGPNSVSKAL